MSKPDREITAWLRQEYGVQRTWIEPGGKHRRICFDYQGVARTVLMGTGPTIKPQAMVNRKADLRRELGPPPVPARKEPRTLEKMMEELRQNAATPPPPLEEALNDTPPESAASQTWDLRVGAYTSKYGKTLLFSFPRSIMKKFPAGIKIEKLDEENWKFASGKGPKFVPYYGDRVKISHYDPTCPVFGSSPGEAVESDGDVLVYCPIATRMATAKPTPWIKTAEGMRPENPAPLPITTPTPLQKVSPMPQQPLLSEPPASPPEPPPAIIVEPVAGNLEARMRAVIAEVKSIEAACPYHLARLESGRIVWRAPVIE